MNPSISQAFLEAERDRDPEYFDREYAALFTDSVSNAFSREAVEACVVSGRRELPYCAEYTYRAAVDPSGGGPDEFCLCIAHKEDQHVVQDCVRAYQSKRPQDVVTEMAQTLKQYRISEVTGDRYSGEWVRQAFRKQDIRYEVSSPTASEAFLELLPAINQGTVELLDDRRQAQQLIALERKRGRTGKDSLGHPAGGHDDRANALALCNCVARTHRHHQIFV